MSLLIIVDKELAENACKQMGLKPPVTTLANRPRNFSHSGMKWENGKWFIVQSAINNGVVSCTSPLLKRKSKINQWGI